MSQPYQQLQQPLPPPHVLEEGLLDPLLFEEIPPSPTNHKTGAINNDEKVINIFRYCLIGLVFIFEFGITEFEAITCTRTTYTGGTRMLLIADPQLTDPYSYKQTGIKLFLTQAISDIFMKRNFNAIVRWTSPDIVYFLGDLFDGGREWEDERWLNEFKRFKNVFPSKGIPQNFIPGNHDIGVANTIIDSAAQQYKSHFGKLNYYQRIGEFIIVNIDAPSFAGNASAVYDFIKEASKLSGKKIIFSHIPMYRPAGTGCLPFPGSQPRPKGITEGHGYQYQNLLSKEQTKILLDSIQPIAIFSGDDHTTCLIHHQVGSSQITEYSVPTFSWLQGTPEPGYALLDLPTGELNSEPNIKLCLFHSQLTLYLSYGFIANLVLCILAFYTFKSRNSFKRFIVISGQVALPPFIAFGLFFGLSLL